MTTSEITGLPRLLGMTALHTEPGKATAAMTVTSEHLAPIGRLHAAAAITLADTLAGYAALASLPPGAHGFATSTITSHHLASADVGDTLHAAAELHHGGRSTQVWDVHVTRANDDQPVADPAVPPAAALPEMTLGPTRHGNDPSGRSRRRALANCPDS